MKKKILYVSWIEFEQCQESWQKKSFLQSKCQGLRYNIQDQGVNGLNLYIAMKEWTPALIIRHLLGKILQPFLWSMHTNPGRNYGSSRLHWEQWPTDPELYAESKRIFLP